MHLLTNLLRHPPLQMRKLSLTEANVPRDVQLVSEVARSTPSESDSEACTGTHHVIMLIHSTGWFEGHHNLYFFLEK